MTTVHSYTNDQQLLDLPHKDLRRARAAALSIIPTTTGAAIGGRRSDAGAEGTSWTASRCACRRRTSRCVDLAVLVDKKTTKEEVNAAFRRPRTARSKGILEYVEAPLVSIDFRGNPHSVDPRRALHRVMDGDFVKMLAWYDNEWGYSNRCVDLLPFLVQEGAVVGSSVKELDLRGKRVFIRVDFNVPIKNGAITDDTRIRASLPTIEYVLEQGARTVILASHLGRPKGKPNPEFSLKPVASAVDLLGQPVQFAEDCIGEPQAAIERPAGVVLLENLRFHAGRRRTTRRSPPSSRRWPTSTSTTRSGRRTGRTHRPRASCGT